MSRTLCAFFVVLALALPACAWPAGWQVERVVQVPAGQLASFSERLGGRVVSMSNTFFTVQGKQIQVNEIILASPQDAENVRKRLGSPLRIFQTGEKVTEILCADPVLMSHAPYDLGLRERTVRYSLNFHVAPISDCDPMAWNQMFNAWLNNDAAKIQALAPAFKFSDTLHFRRYGQGSAASQFVFDPQANDRDGVFRFPWLPSRYGVPQVGVNATVVSEAFAATPGRATPEDVAATRFWPVSDAKVKSIAQSITADSATPQKRVEALLAWMIPGRNLKYGGPAIGSRYGVLTFLEQKNGHCWDFSDAFITLARASGVPARQVTGWLAGVEGHVWAEVYLDGGWVGVDPTAGAGCGSNYVPLYSTAIGNPPPVYTSRVIIAP